MVTLTDRQRLVVHMLARGCGSEEICAELGIKERTVKAYTVTLRHKLGVSKRREIPSAYREQTGDDPWLPVILKGTK